MSITTTVSTITPKYLMGKTKEEVIDLFMMSLKENDRLAAGLREIAKHEKDMLSPVLRAIGKQAREALGELA